MKNINLFVTEEAILKISEFMELKDPRPLGIRIFVYNDERGNVNHSMSFVNEVNSSDIIFNIQNITFITDPNSSIFLNDITLDFISVGASQGFVFKNNCISKNCFNCNGSCHEQRIS